MSELKRAARALVETRTERFEGRHPLAASRIRLDEALARIEPASATVFTPTWSEHEGRAVLDARFAPPARTQRLLRVLSLGMALAVAVSAWAIATQEGPMQFMLPLFTGLSVLALPFVALGLSSQREAAEARIKRAIRVALMDEPERMPAPQRLEGEED
jgi:hypothetical protein